MPNARNLELRPVKPAAGRGRVQRGVRRAFWAAQKSALSTSEIMAWTHPRPIWVRKHNPRNNQRRSIRRVCEIVCIRVGRAATIGRPWLWRLRNTEEK